MPVRHPGAIAIPARRIAAVATWQLVVHYVGDHWVAGLGQEIATMRSIASRAGPAISDATWTS